MFRRWRWITRSSKSPSGSRSGYSSRQLNCHILSISILRNIFLIPSNNNPKRRTELSSGMAADPCIFLSLHWLRQEVEQWRVAVQAYSSECLLCTIPVSVSGTHLWETAARCCPLNEVLWRILITTTAPPAVQTPLHLISTLTCHVTGFCVPLPAFLPAWPFYSENGTDSWHALPNTSIR